MGNNDKYSISCIVDNTQPEIKAMQEKDIKRRLLCELAEMICSGQLMTIKVTREEQPDIYNSPGLDTSRITYNAALVRVPEMQIIIRPSMPATGRNHRKKDRARARMARAERRKREKAKAAIKYFDDLEHEVYGRLIQQVIGGYRMNRGNTDYIQAMQEILGREAKKETQRQERKIIQDFTATGQITPQGMNTAIKNLQAALAICREQQALVIANASTAAVIRRKFNREEVEVIISPAVETLTAYVVKDEKLKQQLLQGIEKIQQAIGGTE